MGRRLSGILPASHRLRRETSLLLLLLMTLLGPLWLASCTTGDDKSGEPADYGNYGMQLAFRLANEDIAYRQAYSDNETATGDLIIDELELLGYVPEIQAFSVTREDGSQVSSRNIIVRIAGEGFYSEEDLELYKERVPATAGAGTIATKERPGVYEKQVIIGTHYDSPASVVSEDPSATSSAETETGGTETGIGSELPVAKFDGISDNASGIAAVLTTARAMRDEKPAYDVVLVFFGAGNDNYRGAQAFLDAMSQTDLSRTDCVYTVQSIYAGDKLYAHAGQNSLLASRKYEMRRKLYEATDVALEHNLRGTMGVDLVMNQGGYMVDVPGFEEPRVFREFTLNEGDYKPFDAAGLPVVFFEAAEYDVGSLAEVTESEHPAFEATGGRVSGTDFDNTSTLRISLGTEILEDRINTMAFIFVEAIKKGSFSFVAVSEAGLEE